MKVCKSVINSSQLESGQLYREEEDIFSLFQLDIDRIERSINDGRSCCIFGVSDRSCFWLAQIPERERGALLTYEQGTNKLLQDV